MSEMGEEHPIKMDPRMTTKVKNNNNENTVHLRKDLQEWVGHKDTSRQDEMLGIANDGTMHKSHSWSDAGGVPYKICRNCPKLLHQLWKALKVI